MIALSIEPFERSSDTRTKLLSSSLMDEIVSLNFRRGTAELSRYLIWLLIDSCNLCHKNMVNSQPEHL